VKADCLAFCIALGKDFVHSTNLSGSSSLLAKTSGAISTERIRKRGRIVLHNIVPSSYVQFVIDN